MARILGESIDMSRQAQIKAGEILHGRIFTRAPVVLARNAK